MPAPVRQIAAAPRLGELTAPPGLRPAPPPAPVDRVDLSGAPEAAGVEPRLEGWQKATLVGLAGLALVGGVVATWVGHVRHAQAGPPDASLVKEVESRKAEEHLTLEDWRQLNLVPSEEAPRVRLPGPGGILLKPVPAPRTVAETRQRLAAIDFPDLDPFVSSVASDVWAGLQGEIKDQAEYLQVPGFEGRLRVGLGLQNGPDAPMLVLLPGVHGNTFDAKVNALKRLALENGMNYAVLPNPTSWSWTHLEPEAMPANHVAEGKMVYEALAALKAKHPQHFRRVSVAGYSYGGILGASTLAYQHQSGRPAVINGSLAALSPPQDMLSSMERLDDLRNRYDEKTSGSILWRWMMYRRDIREHGFEGLSKTTLPGRRGSGALTEVKMADVFGSRLGLQELVRNVDRTWEHNRLPVHAARASGAYDEMTREQRDQLYQSQRDLLDQVRYQDYLEGYLEGDPWWTEHGTTPRDLSAASTYATLLERASGSGVQVMTLVSADDYILSPEDVAAFRRMESARTAGQATRVFDKGGHTGLYFHPQVREAMIDFLSRPPAQE